MRYFRENIIIAKLMPVWYLYRTMAFYFILFYMMLGRPDRHSVQVGFEAALQHSCASL